MRMERTRSPSRWTVTTGPFWDSEWAQSECAATPEPVGTKASLPELELSERLSGMWEKNGTNVSDMAFLTIAGGNSKHDGDAAVALVCGLAAVHGHCRAEAGDFLNLGGFDIVVHKHAPGGVSPVG